MNNRPKTEREARLRLCHYFRAAERGAVGKWCAAQIAALKIEDDTQRFGDAWHGGPQGSRRGAAPAEARQTPARNERHDLADSNAASGDEVSVFLRKQHRGHRAICLCNDPKWLATR